MRVTADGVDLPAGVMVDVSMSPERSFLTIRISATSPDRFALAALADGKPHVFEWWDDSGSKYAELHAKLSLRFTGRHPTGDQPDMLEVTGPCWGPPPNYGRFLVGGA